MNTLEDIAKQARTLMNEHGLHNVDFKFDRAQKRIGQCRFRGGVPFEITLSKVLTPKMEAHDVRDTILHEIAHALVGIDAGHGPRWKAKAREIGARPQRCGKQIDLDAPIQGFCPDCGDKVHDAFRMPTVLRYHPKCGKDAILVYHKEGKRVPLVRMPLKYQQAMAMLRKPATIGAAHSLEDFFRL